MKSRAMTARLLPHASGGVGNQPVLYLIETPPRKE
jgi:hypothetical protein